LPDGVDLYSVSTAADSTRGNYPPSEWLAEEGWTIPVLVDDTSGTVSRAYGLNAFPFTVFVTAEGLIAGRLSGGIPIDGFLSIVGQLAE
jgi:hypothetical protein